MKPVANKRMVGWPHAWHMFRPGRLITFVPKRAPDLTEQQNRDMWAATLRELRKGSA